LRGRHERQEREPEYEHRLSAVNARHLGSGDYLEEHQRKKSRSLDAVCIRLPNAIDLVEVVFLHPLFIDAHWAPQDRPIARSDRR
jgi:hypothetical protein